MARIAEDVVICWALQSRTLQFFKGFPRYIYVALMDTSLELVITCMPRFWLVSLPYHCSTH